MILIRPAFISHDSQKTGKKILDKTIKSYVENSEFLLLTIHHNENRAKCTEHQVLLSALEPGLPVFQLMT